MEIVQGASDERVRRFILPKSFIPKVTINYLPPFNASHCYLFDYVPFFVNQTECYLRRFSAGCNPGYLDT